MAADPGSTFSGHALAALTRARTHFENDRWAAGMQAASAEALRSAFDEALRATARAASRSRQTVRQLVPMDEAEQILSGWGQKQSVALETAHRYGSSFNSFLARSIHIEEPTAAAYLRALAARHHDDECIRAPLWDFADALARWQQLMERCAASIGGNASLRSGFRVRRLMRLALAVAGGLVVLVTLAAGAWWYWVAEASRKRLATALENPDSCADETLSASDRKHARASQLEALRVRAERCTEQRRREQYVSACLSLADHLEAGKLTPQDDALAPEAAPLLKRIASGTLTAADLLISDDGLPCQNTPSGARLWGAMARSASSASELWGQVDKVSPRMISELTQDRFALTAECKDRVGARADAAARRAVVSGRDDELVHARQLCALQQTLRIEPLGRGCRALSRIAARAQP